MKFFDKLFSLCFLYILDSPVLSNPPPQVLSLELLSLYALSMQHFLSLRFNLQRTFLNLVHISCVDFAPSGPFLIGWAFLHLTALDQNAIFIKTPTAMRAVALDSACWSSPLSWASLESRSWLTSSYISLQPLFACSAFGACSLIMHCSQCSLEQAVGLSYWPELYSWSSCTVSVTWLDTWTIGELQDLHHPRAIPPLQLDLPFGCSTSKVSTLGSCWAALLGQKLKYQIPDLAFLHNISRPLLHQNVTRFKYEIWCNHRKNTNFWLESWCTVLQRYPPNALVSLVPS